LIKIGLNAYGLIVATNIDNYKYMYAYPLNNYWWYILLRRCTDTNYFSGEGKKSKVETSKCNIRVECIGHLIL